MPFPIFPSSFLLSFSLTTLTQPLLWTTRPTNRRWQATIGQPSPFPLSHFPLPSLSHLTHLPILLLFFPFFPFLSLLNSTAIFFSPIHSWSPKKRVSLFYALFYFICEI